MNKGTFIDLQPLLNSSNNCAMSLVTKEFATISNYALATVRNASMAGVGTKLATLHENLVSILRESRDEPVRLSTKLCVSETMLDARSMRIAARPASLAQVIILQPYEQATLIIS
jgi:hypothetical protein